MEKLKHVMQWREEEGAPTIFDLIALGNGPESAPEAVENPEGLTKAKALVYSLNYASSFVGWRDARAKRTMDRPACTILKI